MILIRPHLVRVTDWLRSPLLFVLRSYWGWQFVQTGWGKLSNLESAAGFFASLGIPLPYWNAMLAGGTELVGGMLLMLGLWARAASAPLILVMVVAYATAHRDVVQVLITDPGKFTAASPFLFLLVSTIVLAFGPGALSVDRLLQPVRNGRNVLD